MSTASTSFSGGTSSPPQVSPDPASSGNGPPMNSGFQAFSAEIPLKPENISPPPASHHTHQPQHHVHGSQHGDQATGANEVGQINQPHFDLHQDFSPPPLTPAGFVEQWEPLTPPNLLFGGAVWNIFFLESPAWSPLEFLSRSQLINHLLIMIKIEFKSIINHPNSSNCYSLAFLKNAILYSYF